MDGILEKKHISIIRGVMIEHSHKKIKKDHLFFRKSTIRYLIPTAIGLALIIHIVAAYVFINDNWFEQPSSYVEVSWIALSLTLYAKMPLYKAVKKSHFTKTYSTFSLSIVVVQTLTNIVSVVWHTFYASYHANGMPLYIVLLRWIPGLIACLVSTYIAIYILTIKVRNKIKNHQTESNHHYGFSWIRLVINITVISIGTASASLMLIYTINNFVLEDDLQLLMLYIVSAIFAVCEILSNIPQVIKTIWTRNTLGIGIFVRFSSLMSISALLLLDFMTRYRQNLESFFPLIIADFVIALWILILMAIKWINLIQCHRLNMDEKTFCEQYLPRCLKLKRHG